MVPYSAVVRDYAGVGMEKLRRTIAKKGIPTPAMMGYNRGRLQDNCVVLFQDNNQFRLRNRFQALSDAGKLLVVHVRSGELDYQSWWGAPPLVEIQVERDVRDNFDSHHNDRNFSVLGHKGLIPADFCYVKGIHKMEDENFPNWRSGKGWSGNGAVTLAVGGNLSFRDRSYVPPVIDLW